MSSSVKPSGGAGGRVNVLVTCALPLIEQRHKRHALAVEIEVAALFVAEGAHALHGHGVDALAEQRGHKRGQLDQQAAALIEAEDAAVKRVIYRACEQLAVLAVGALFVAGVATGFAVAGDEVLESVDANAGDRVGGTLLPVVPRGRATQAVMPLGC